MTYTINNTDNSLQILLPDEQTNTEYSVTLLGRNVRNFGELVAENSIKQMESFASETAPTNPLVGQLWYDKRENLLTVWTGGVWRRIGISFGTAPVDNLVPGTAYFDNQTQLLRIYDGSRFLPASYPGEVVGNSGAKSGTRLRNIFLRDSSDVPRSVLALTYVDDSESTGTQLDDAHEKIMAIFSDAAFDVGNFNSSTQGEIVNYYAEINNFFGGRIRKGITLRAEYAQTAVPLAERAVFADSANGILISGEIIDSANIIHTGRGYIPVDDGVRNLGSSTKRFSSAHVNQFVAHTAITAQNAGVSIGESGTPFANLFITDATVGNSITVTSVVNTDTVVASNADITTANIAGLSYPGSDGTAGQVIVTDGNGVLTFGSIITGFTSANIVSGAGIDFSPDQEYDGNTEITISVDTSVVRTTGGGVQEISRSTKFTSELFTADINTQNNDITLGTGTVTFGGLTSGGNVVIDEILDEDVFTSNSNTALATQQSIKSYVDARTSGNITANIIGQVSNISNHTTDDLVEGSANLYYTTTRANSAIDARVTTGFVNSLNVDAESISNTVLANIVHGQNGNRTTNNNNWNIAIPSGFYDQEGNVSHPERLGAPTTTWYTMINARHSNTENYFANQIAGSFYDVNDFYYRNVSNGAPTNWYKILHSNNYAPVLDSRYARFLGSYTTPQFANGSNGNYTFTFASPLDILAGGSFPDAVPLIILAHDTFVIFTPPGDSPPLPLKYSLVSAKYVRSGGQLEVTINIDGAGFIWPRTLTFLMYGTGTVV